MEMSSERMLSGFSAEPTEYRPFPWLMIRVFWEPWNGAVLMGVYEVAHSGMLSMAFWSIPVTVRDADCTCPQMAEFQLLRWKSWSHSM